MTILLIVLPRLFSTIMVIVREFVAFVVAIVLYVVLRVLRVLLLGLVGERGCIRIELWGDDAGLKIRTHRL